jgi:hypothetical protein
MTETGRIRGSRVVAPGFHAGRSWFLRPPGVEARRYERISLFDARFGELNFGHSCLFRISCFGFVLPMFRFVHISKTFCSFQSMLERKALMLWVAHGELPCCMLARILVYLKETFNLWRRVDLHGQFQLETFRRHIAGLGGIE